MKRGNMPFSTLRKLEEVLSEYARNNDEHQVLGNFNLYHSIGGEKIVLLLTQSQNI